ncbi:MAG: hypothetical protein K2F84_04725, partial [Bacteroidales bacterium]|nr:hypothetical protein [Bacteroidales bacterium]
MKKLFMLILATLGLTGWAAAQADDMWVTPQPLKAYLCENTNVRKGEFLDLNTAYTVEADGTVNISDAATAYGIRDVYPFGENLAAGTALNDMFFGYDNGEWVTATRTDADSKVTALFLEELDVPSFSFMEKRVTGLILSAAGGVYFTDDASGAPVEMTLPDPLAGLKAQSVRYAARGFIAKYIPETTGSMTRILTSIPITKMADRPA